MKTRNSQIIRFYLAPIPEWVWPEVGESGIAIYSSFLVKWTLLEHARCEKIFGLPYLVLEGSFWRVSGSSARRRFVHLPLFHPNAEEMVQQIRKFAPPFSSIHTALVDFEHNQSSYERAAARMLPVLIFLTIGLMGLIFWLAAGMPGWRI